MTISLAGGCFGAVVVKNGKIVGEGYNNVISRNDPTWCAPPPAPNASAITHC
jgi:tRNA(Arg) A34 adenosine deaminase TadA